MRINACIDVLDACVEVWCKARWIAGRVAGAGRVGKGVEGDADSVGRKDGLVRLEDG